MKEKDVKMNKKQAAIGRLKETERYWKLRWEALDHTVCRTCCGQHFGPVRRRSWDRASLMYVFKYNQQDSTLYNIPYYCQCSRCFRRIFRPSSGAQKLYTQHRVYVKLACFYRQNGWVLRNCTHSIGYTASKLDVYPLLCVQFLSS